MFLGLRVGSLVEPLADRQWDPPTIQRELCQRVVFLQRHRVAPGDRVFLHYGNTLEFFVDLLAIWSLGGCAIPIDPRLTAFEIENLARAAVPRLSLWRGEVESEVLGTLSSLRVKALKTPAPMSQGSTAPSLSLPCNLLSLDQPALILFTSGTTGQPKGVVHTHRSLRARWMSLQQSLGVKKFRRTLCVLPTHFGHGLICNCLFPWLSGQSLFIAKPSRPDLLMRLGPLVDDCQITFMSSVPSLWRLALRTARPPERGSLERVCCGSAPLSASLWEGIRNWTGTTEVLNAYGITETGSWIAGTTMKNAMPEDGLIGVPWGAAVKILESSSTDVPPHMLTECAPSEAGYVWINTPGLMRGYLGREDMTNQVVAQGWFYTGDIGLVDERGLLYLRGRKREEINVGGTKVYPADIDTVAERYEHTVDACSFAYADPLYGENIGIAVVLRSADSDCILGLYRFLRHHLAEFQMPRRWYHLEQIARTSNGKTNRAQIAQLCADREPISIQGLVRETI